MRRLDEALAVVTFHTERLAANARDDDDAQAIVALRRSLAPVVDAVRRVRDQIADTHAELTPDTQECILRMRSTAIRLELAQLVAVEHEVAPKTFTGRFTCARGFASFVLGLLERIHESLVRERAQLATTPARADTRRAIFQIALANAEWAFEVIGKDRHVARFLAEAASVHSDRFRASCQVIGILLGVAQRSELRSREQQRFAASR